MSMKTALKNNVSQIERARIIKRTLGITVAAKYLMVRGWTVQAAAHYLAGRQIEGKATYTEYKKSWGITWRTL